MHLTSISYTSHRQCRLNGTYAYCAVENYEGGFMYRTCVCFYAMMSCNGKKMKAFVFVKVVDIYSPSL